MRLINDLVHGGVLNDDHLRFRLKGCGEDEKSCNNLVEGYRSKDAEKSLSNERAIVKILGLDAWEELNQTWAFQHGRAVSIWNVELHDVMTFAEIEAKVLSRIPAASRPAFKRKTDDWVSIPARASASGEIEPRIARVAHSESGLRVVVHLVKNVTFRQEEERKSEQQTVPVEFEIPRGEPGNVRVFTSAQNGREALRQWMRWALELKVPAGPGQANFYKAVPFNDAHAKRTAAVCKMAISGVVSNHTSGKNGEYSVKGVQDGEKLLPLDPSDSDVERQTKAVGKERLFNYRFSHVDGYVEHGRVNFNLKTKPAHLEFQLKTSRQAMDWVVTKLLGVLAE